jgi:hypothetical protein
LSATPGPISGKHGADKESDRIFADKTSLLTVSSSDLFRRCHDKKSTVARPLHFGAGHATHFVR